MTDADREPARDPQDLERLLVARQRSGDIEGMLALFEPGAIIHTDDGRVVIGHEAMRAYYRELAADGRIFVMGEQRPALVNGDLALTSTPSADGSVTAEVARRQPDGTWLWVIDEYEIAHPAGAKVAAGSQADRDEPGRGARQEWPDGTGRPSAAEVDAAEVE